MVDIASVENSNYVPHELSASYLWSSSVSITVWFGSLDRATDPKSKSDNKAYIRGQCIRAQHKLRIVNRSGRDVLLLPVPVPTCEFLVIFRVRLSFRDIPRIYINNMLSATN